MPSAASVPPAKPIRIRPTYSIAKQAITRAHRPRASALEWRGSAIQPASRTGLKIKNRNRFNRLFKTRIERYRLGPCPY